MADEYSCLNFITEPYEFPFRPEIEFAGDQSEELAKAIANGESLDSIKLMIVRSDYYNNALCRAVERNSIAIAKELIIMGADVNLSETTRPYNYPVILAAKNSNMKMLEMLEKSGANLDAYNEDYENALYWAVKTNNSQMIQHIVDISKNMKNLFFCAIEAGNIPLMKAALESKTCAPVNINATADNKGLNFEPEIQRSQRYIYHGYTGLEIAFDLGQRDIIKFLLERGAKSKPFMLFERTFTGDLELIQLILKSIDVNTTDQHNETALMIAIHKNFDDIARYLIDMKTNLNVVSDKGQTALSIALKHKNLAMADLLISKGANINFVQKNTGTFLEHYIKDMEMVKFLVEHKINVNGHGRTIPLAKAVTKGLVDVVQYLLDHGASINVTLKDKTPLILAIEKGNTKIFDMLLQRKPMLDLGTPTSPLNTAIMNCSLEMASKLLANGASVNKSAPENPLVTVAKIQKNRVPIAQLLLENGGNIEASSTTFESPLGAAIYYNRIDLFDYYLSKGASHTSRYYLALSARYGFLHGCKKMLELGVNIDEPRKCPPILEAYLKKHKEIEGFLQDKGARVDALLLEKENERNRMMEAKQEEMLRLQREKLEEDRRHNERMQQQARARANMEAQFYQEQLWQQQRHDWEVECELRRYH